MGYVGKYWRFKILVTVPRLFWNAKEAPGVRWLEDEEWNRDLPTIRKVLVLYRTTFLFFWKLYIHKKFTNRSGWIPVFEVDDFIQRYIHSPGNINSSVLNETSRMCLSYSQETHRRGMIGFSSAPGSRLIHSRLLCNCFVFVRCTTKQWIFSKDFFSFLFFMVLLERFS